MPDTPRPRRPRTRSPQPCRYCGHVSTNHCREGKDNCLAYACRDAIACGYRIRGGKPPPELKPDDGRRTRTIGDDERR